MFTLSIREVACQTVMNKMKPLFYFKPALLSHGEKSGVRIIIRSKANLDFYFRAELNSHFIQLSYVSN